MKIFSITKAPYKCELKFNTNYDYYFTKVIPLSENRIVAAGDTGITIYNANIPYNLIKTINCFNKIKYSVNNVIELKRKGMLVSAIRWEHNTNVYNLKTYQIKAIFQEVECEAPNSMSETNNNKLIVGGKGIISIIELN